MDIKTGELVSQVFMSRCSGFCLRRAVIHRWSSLRENGVQRGRVVKVEHVQQRTGMHIATGKVQPGLTHYRSEESRFDKGQQRGVIAVRMRYIARL